MTETGLPAESRSSGLEQARSKEVTIDRTLSVAIGMLLTGLLALGVWWGYSAWMATQKQSLSSPAARSIETLKVKVAASPRDAALRVRLAEALGAANRTDEGINQLREALKIDPKHTGAWLDLGLLLIDKRDVKNAPPAFKKVVELTEGSEMEGVNQRREQALYYLARLSLQEKQYADASRYIKGALRIRRDASDSYLILAQAYQGMGDGDRAIKNLKIALTFDPSFGQAHFVYAQIEKERGDILSATRHLRKVLDGAPSAQPALELLATFGKADDWTAKAVKANAAGDVKAAKKNAEIALAIDPANVKAALLYAALLQKAGDKKNAKLAYQQVLELDATNAEAKAALKRLSTAK
jgi:tetratricopeptide (TPR) repeat protein